MRACMHTHTLMHTHREFSLIHITSHPTQLQKCNSIYIYMYILYKLQISLLWLFHLVLIHEKEKQLHIKSRFMILSVCFTGFQIVWWRTSTYSQSRQADLYWQYIHSCYSKVWTFNQKPHLHLLELRQQHL